jgi:putative acetyltransferase
VKQALNKIAIKRSDSEDQNFQRLAGDLDVDLKIRDGEDHEFYAQLNKIDKLANVVVAYEGDVAIGCGAIRKFDDHSMEVKRMYVTPGNRQRGIASMILKELENWTTELGYSKCILETGKNQSEAIAFYTKNGYRRIPNFGAYKDVPNSVCFEKELDNRVT